MRTKVLSKRLFNIEKNNAGKEYLVFDRTEPSNQNDIHNCAALALHKAILGICELNYLENAELNMEYAFRQSRAVQTYYIIYHLFTCCILMDSHRELRFYPRDIDSFRYGTTPEELNNPVEDPATWNRCKELEQDLATNLNHGSLRTYCEWLRRRFNDNSREYDSSRRMVYEAFVKDSPNLVLFEKAEYIRDRSIYRPSWVPNENGSSIQTSKEARKEIDSLPRSEELYRFVLRFYRALCSENTKFVYKFLGALVLCPDDYMEYLGYSRDMLKEMGGDEDSVPPYVCHMMELYPPQVALTAYKKYWLPLISNQEEAGLSHG